MQPRIFQAYSQLDLISILTFYPKINTKLEDLNTANAFYVLGRTGVF